MQITIKIINGDEHKIEIEAENTVQELKNRLADRLKTPSGQLRLMYKGKPLSSDSQTLKDYSIGPDAKLNLILKKDNESNLTKQLKLFGDSYVTDVNEFAAIFNKELKNLVNEMSLDDIERYEEYKASLSQSETH